MFNPSLCGGFAPQKLVFVRRHRSCDRTSAHFSLPSLPLDATRLLPRMPHNGRLDVDAVLVCVGGAKIRASICGRLAAFPKPLPSLPLALRASQRPMRGKGGMGEGRLVASYALGSCRPRGQRHWTHDAPGPLRSVKRPWGWGLDRSDDRCERTGCAVRQELDDTGWKGPCPCARRYHLVPLPPRIGRWPHGRRYGRLHLRAVPQAVAAREEGPCASTRAGYDHLKSRCKPGRQSLPICSRSSRQGRRRGSWG